MKYEYWLATLYRLGNEKRRHVCEMTGCAKEFYNLSDRQLKSLHLFSEEERACIKYSKEKFEVDCKMKLNT